MSWLSTAVRWAEAKLDKLTENVPPNVKNDLGVFFETFAETAKSAVLAEAGKVISGQEKLGNAAAVVLEAAAKAGWTAVAPTAAITLVQTIVTATRMNEGTPLVVPPPGVGSTPAKVA